MTTAPLVLYRADSIDARHAAEQIRRRWTGARVETLEQYTSGNSPAGMAPVWLINVDRPAHLKDGDTVCLTPTPDASITMQAWDLLHAGEAPCQDCDRADDPMDEPTACETCDGTGWVCPEPPHHLLYLDDAVCGRPLTGEARAWWAWAQSETVEHAVRLAFAADEDPGRRELQLIQGLAILRARERWEKEATITWERMASEREEAEENEARLRTERDDAEVIASQLHTELEGARRERDAMLARNGELAREIGRLETERDALKEELRAARFEVKA